MPPEYFDYYLCKHVYHCLPSQLDAEDPSRLLAHLTCLDVENQIAKARGH